MLICKSWDNRLPARKIFLAQTNHFLPKVLFQNDIKYKFSFYSQFKRLVLNRNSTNHQMIVIRLSMEHIPLLLFSGVDFSYPSQAQLATQSNHKINKRKTWALRKGSAEQKRGEKQALLFLYATIGMVQRKLCRRHHPPKMHCHRHRLRLPINKNLCFLYC